MSTNDNTTPTTNDTTPMTNDTTTTTTITTTNDTTTPMTNNPTPSKPKPTKTILIRKHEEIRKDGTKIIDSITLKTKSNDGSLLRKFLNEK
ncbi:hypothetical protein F8M41_017773 [Gigaspora margarita]|uniref:Uncharacterized protein n=1 Tax=Gigaspora margarita TaxID=4874 RepID=A0A8H4AMQ6_GIGMA|nr:hypothetical protein F8M41_017773 [Gigaspora margarita]